LQPLPRCCDASLLLRARLMTASRPAHNFTAAPNGLRLSGARKGVRCSGGLASTPPLERKKMSGATNEVSALASKIDAPMELVLTPRAIPQNPALGPVVTARMEVYHFLPLTFDRNEPPYSP
jgi:hypothetical protein